jgi:oligosaccharide repeat unit polymerase
MSHTVAFVVASVWTLGVLLVFWRRYGNLDLFAPGFVITLTLALGYLGPFFAFESEIDGFSRYWPFEFEDRDGAVSGALLLYCLMLLGVLVGCVLGGPPAIKAARGRRMVQVVGARELLFLPYWTVVLGTALVLFAVGVVLLGGLEVLLSGLGDRIRLLAGLNYFFIPVNAFMSAGLASAAVVLGKRNEGPQVAARTVRRNVFIFALLSLAAVGFGVILGNKSNIYVFVLALLVCFHHCRRRFSLLELALIGVLLFAGLMVFQLFVREFLVVGEVVSLEGLNVGEFLGYSFLQLTGNVMQLQTLSVLVDQVPEGLAYQLGKTLLAFVTLPVPSTIWPDKPLPSPGIFTLAFWPEMWLEHGTTMPPGLMGECYLNFGVVGVLLGSILLSFVFERFHSRVVGSGKAPAEALLYYAALVGTLLHYVRGEFSAPTLLLLSIVVPIWLARKIRGFGPR